jgi:hypothetical protein
VATGGADYEGQTNGTAATIANSDDFGDSPMETVTPGAGGTINYSASHPAALTSTGLTFSQATAATQCFARYAMDGSDFSACAFRFYLYLTGLPGTDANFPCRVMTALGASVFQVLGRTTGVLRLADTAGAVIVSTTAAMAAGTLYRIEVQASNLNTGTTTLSLQLFQGQNTSPESGGSITSSTVTTTALGRLLTLGKTSTSAIPDWYVDEVAWVTGSSTPIGPAAVAPSPWSYTYDVRIG